jgi:CheY-like chemotaxis protein
MSLRETSGPDIPILVLDDDRLNRDLLARVLERWGYRQVECLEDPLLFLARLPGLSRAVLFVDWHMPYMNGLEVLQALQLHRAPGAQIRTVLVTGECSEDLESRAVRAGAASVLTKPYGLPELRMLLEGLVAEVCGPSEP